MSDRHTPRTDAEADNASLCDQCVPAEFARQLERELSEAKEQANHWKAQCHRGFNVAEIIAQRDALLEALEELHAAMVRYDGDVDGEAPSEHHQMMSRVISAIALAKGGGQ